MRNPFTHSFRLLLAAAICALAFSGCSSGPKPRSAYVRSVDFTQYRTFAILPAPTSVLGVDQGLVQRLGPTVTQAARISMALKGFIEVSDPKGADLVVLVHGTALPKTGAGAYTADSSAFRRYPLGGAESGTLSTDAYREGTMAAEVFDAKTNKRIWAGWMITKVKKSKKKLVEIEGVADRASEQVSMVFTQFPAMGGMPLN